MATQKRQSGGRRTASSSRTTGGSGKRTAARSSGGSRKRTSSSRSGGRGRQSARTPRPIRRGVGAFLCFLLAVFALLSCFGIQTPFLDVLCGLAKGLIGYGFYLLPLALLWASFILTFHRGRPVQARVWCAMLLPVALGGLLHLILARSSYSWNLELFQTLWTQGRALQSGGVISGMLALVLSAGLTKIGAGILFVLIACGLGMGGANFTLVDLVDYIRDRPPYEEEELPPKPRRTREAPARTEPKSPVRRRPAIDIPMDDGDGEEDAGEEAPRENPLSAIFQKKERLFNRSPSVPTPDQVLAEEEPMEPVELHKLEPVRDSGGEEPEETLPAAEEPAPPEADEDLPFERLLRPDRRMDSAVKIEREPAPVRPEPEPEDSPAPGFAVEREPAVPRPTQPSAPGGAEVAADLQRSLEEGAADQYHYPPLDLLRPSRSVAATDVAGELRTNQLRLADAIHSFGIDANIVDTVRGPSVTRYELELAQGVRMNKLTNLTDDIALALGATGVRIAPIPDKISMVGIEVPNKLVAPVGIRDVIDSREFRESASKVSFAVGKDISNRCVVCDIGKLPHLLIAGTTGSGKSVCTNSLIISLLYKATPEEVRLIMVDPKMVELGIYNGIPHLLIPVVTDPKKAAGALQWAVTEMMKRYRSFAEVNVRDLKSYNALAARTEGMKTMPSIVVVIDELADLMLVAAKEVEESICRVAQMGRAAGMHLIIATQRPSADVITGLMKANIPSRIAFAVQSSLDSRIILDTTGAEKLVGRGDMLYFPLGSGKPQRVQGCFISDEEVSAVVDFVKRSGAAEYDEAVLHEIEQNAAAKDKGKGGDVPAESGGEEYDELLPNAIEVVVDTGMASVSMLQRRLKLGYSRAARLVDQMEEKGIVGPFEGSKPRQVLITKAQWQEMQYKQHMPTGAPPLSEPVPDELEYERDAVEQDRPPF